MLRSFQDLVKVMMLAPAKYAAVYFPRKTVAGDYDKLFDILRTGNPAREESVAESLYGTHDSKTMTRYFTTKSRLKDRIENGFFFLDTERLSHRAAHEYASWKEQLIVWALWRVGARETAVQRLERLVPDAERLGLTDVCIFAYEKMRSFHASQGSMVLTKKYDALLADAFNRKAAELKAGGLLAEIEVFRARETLLSENHIELCERTEREIASMLGEARYPTDSMLFTLSLQHGTAAQYLAEARADYQGAIRAICSVEQQPTHTPLLPGNDVLSALAVRKLPYALVLRDTDTAEEALKTALGDTSPEMIEALIFHEYAFLTMLGATGFDAAADLLAKMLSLPAAVRFADEVGDRLRLYEAYMRVLLHDDMPQRPTLFKPRFFSRKFYTEHPRSAQNDKEFSTAYRASVAVMHLLDLVRERNFEAMADFCKDIAVYEEKYLRKDTPEYRLQCFLRMVLTAARANFDFDETARKTRKYLDWLSSARAFDTIALGTFEVLPFDRAWTLILYTMKHKQEKMPKTPKEILHTVKSPYEFY